MDATEAKRLQTLVGGWVNRSDALRALALCGSWARGSARPDSDLDLLVIARDTTEPARARLLESIPFNNEGFTRESCRWITYGVVHSAHIALHPKAELELTFARESWASIDPLDAGTLEVVRTGFVILIDKDGALAELVAATSRQ